MINYSTLTTEQAAVYQKLLDKYYYECSDSITSQIPSFNGKNQFEISIMTGMAKRRKTIEDCVVKYPWIMSLLKILKPFDTQSFVYEGNIIRYKDLCRALDEKYNLEMREASRILYVVKDIWNLKLYSNGNILLFSNGKLILINGKRVNLSATPKPQAQPAPVKKEPELSKVPSNLKANTIPAFTPPLLKPEEPVAPKPQPVPVKKEEPVVFAQPQPVPSSTYEPSILDMLDKKVSASTSVPTSASPVNELPPMPTILTPQTNPQPAFIPPSSSPFLKQQPTATPPVSNSKPIFPQQVSSAPKPTFTPPPVQQQPSVAPKPAQPANKSNSPLAGLWGKR